MSNVNEHCCARYLVYVYLTLCLLSIYNPLLRINSQLKVREQPMVEWQRVVIFYISSIWHFVMLNPTLTKGIMPDMKFNLHVFFSYWTNAWSPKQDICGHYYNFNRYKETTKQKANFLFNITLSLFSHILFRSIRSLYSSENFVI